MDNKKIKKLRDQIDKILSRNKDNEEFLRWAVLKLSVLEGALLERK